MSAEEEREIRRQRLLYELPNFLTLHNMLTGFGIAGQNRSEAIYWQSRGVLGGQDHNSDILVMFTDGVVEMMLVCAAFSLGREFLWAQIPRELRP